MKKIAFALALFLLPLAVSAAGFAQQSLFLSQNSVTEGDTVLIHAVVSNDSAAAFAGQLKFHDDSGAIGTVPVSLDPGEASAVSVSWKPAAGSHTVVAELFDAAGSSVGQESAIFFIAQKPEPAAKGMQPPAVDSSEAIVKTIAGVSPAAAKEAQPVFSVIDSARASAAHALDNGITWSKQQLGGKVLGAQTQKAAGAQSGWQGTLWTVVGTLALYVLSILRFIVGSAGICYPVIALLFLYFLWRLYRRMRRPRY